MYEDSSEIKEILSKILQASENTDVPPQKISEDQARQFLTAEFGSAEGLEPLGGGFWSTAFGFSRRGEDYVIRFGQSREWFEADRAAMAFSSPSLPVPEVTEVGEAFGSV